MFFHSIDMDVLWTNLAKISGFSLRSLSLAVKKVFMILILSKDFKVFFVFL
jgi:hypothetical protein